MTHGLFSPTKPLRSCLKAELQEAMAEVEETRMKIAERKAEAEETKMKVAETVAEARETKMKDEMKMAETMAEAKESKKEERKVEALEAWNEFTVRAKKENGKLGCSVETLMKDFCILKRIEPGCPLKGVERFDRVLKVNGIGAKAARLSLGCTCFAKVALKVLSDIGNCMKLHSQGV